jgi:CHAT domain-containing protein
LQVLISAPPPAAPTEAGRYRAAAWLARETPVTVLPSAGALVALRGRARPSAAPRPYLGVGNPLLNGPDAAYAGLAAEAQGKQDCAVVPASWRTSLIGVRGVTRHIVTAGKLADTAFLLTQYPLPETADELCRVASDLKAGTGAVRLGRNASETEIKRLSKDGALARYRVLHFATHGAMAGEVAGASEPGLILTPPAEASSLDDGYLSAGEIAALKLDAELVILSACNTAAGGAGETEALSGLARAFFYSGARALFVSHWAVSSTATVKLITAALGAIGEDSRTGRAEALRRAMLSLIDQGEPEETHPAYWAPFVVVGESTR